MSDYISRENALLALDDFLDSEQEYGVIANCYSVADVEKAKNRIMCIPSAVGIDVTEIKHGKWLINSDGYYPYCSCCKEEPPSGAMTKFCPNCGVKMDME